MSFFASCRKTTRSGRNSWSGRNPDTFAGKNRYPKTCFSYLKYPAQILSCDNGEFCCFGAQIPSRHF